MNQSSKAQMPDGFVKEEGGGRCSSKKLIDALGQSKGTKSDLINVACR